jgi:hypothetical protein
VFSVVCQLKEQHRYRLIRRLIARRMARSRDVCGYAWLQNEMQISR